MKATGIGIPSDKSSVIFERYSQVDGASPRCAVGLGIGLSLAQQLVELHGSTVVAHSAGLGTGSVFVVRLPVRVEQPKIPPDPSVDRAVPLLASEC